MPWGFRKILNWIKERFNSPRIFITECGFSDDGRINDDARINNTRVSNELNNCLSLICVSQNMTIV